MSSLEYAAAAWREGRILDARREYQAVVRVDPSSWGAAFQLAWLDSAFGELSTASVRALDRDGLSPSARHLVKALDDMARYPAPLDGRVEDWDIGTLRQQGAGERFSTWWEARAKAAAKAGLYGVALACFEEAESREPNGAYWDPPAWTHSLPAELENHLELVAHPFAD